MNWRHGLRDLCDTLLFAILAGGLLAALMHWGVVQ